MYFFVKIACRKYVKKRRKYPDMHIVHTGWEHAGKMSLVHLIPCMQSRYGRDIKKNISAYITWGNTCIFMKYKNFRIQKGWKKQKSQTCMHE